MAHNRLLLLLLLLPPPLLLILSSYAEEDDIVGSAELTYCRIQTTAVISETHFENVLVELPGKMTKLVRLVWLQQ